MSWLKSKVPTSNRSPTREIFLWQIMNETVHITKENESFQGVRFIGFDLDGTLFAEPDKSFPHVFAENASHLLGIPSAEAEAFAASTMGISTTKQLQQLPDCINMPADHIARNLPFALQQLIADTIDTEFFLQPVTIFPDILPVLTQLKQEGKHIFISSSRPTENIHAVLTQHPEIAQCIDFAIGTSKEDPNLKKGETHFKKVAEHFHVPFEKLVQQSVFIGDTPSDMQAAQSINVLAIGRIGTTSSATLLQRGATLTLPDFSSLPHMLNVQRTSASFEHYGRR